MKNKMTQKQLDWNKELLKQEWDYCIKLIGEHIKDLDDFTLEEHNGLSEQHMFMNVVRELVGKGHHFYMPQSPVLFHLDADREVCYFPEAYLFVW